MNVIEKPFTWSYSRLTAFETCPRRYYETQVLKKWGEERSEALTYGEDVHLAMATALKQGTPLPITYAMYQEWIDRVNRTPGELLTECKWAITREFKPTAWFSDKVWLRSIADAVKVDDNVALVVDWKTGKSANADEIQLVLTSLMAFILFPKVLRVRADFAWLQEDRNSTQVIDRHEAADAWAEILPRVEKLQQAVNDGCFPPQPNRFCNKWCPVRSCEFFGTRQ